MKTRRYYKRRSMRTALNNLHEMRVEPAIRAAYAFIMIGGKNKVQRVVALYRLVKAGCSVGLTELPVYYRLSIDGQPMTPNQIVMAGRQTLRRKVVKVAA